VRSATPSTSEPAGRRLRANKKHALCSGGISSRRAADQRPGDQVVRDRQADLIINNSDRRAPSQVGRRITEARHQIADCRCPCENQNSKGSVMSPAMLHDFNFKIG
jgi:hypothetical protein